MRRFTQLYDELDESNRTNEKVGALVRYFRDVPPRDAAWALFFLTGQKIKRSVSGPLLRRWIGELADLPPWMVEECYDAVGDVAETAALLLPEAPGAGQALPPLHALVEDRLVPLPAAAEPDRRALLADTWLEMDQRQRYVWNKLITGEFRVGVARTLVVRALAQVAEVPPGTMAHRVMGDWKPVEADYLRIMSGDAGEHDPRRPYPFYLAHPLETENPKLAPKLPDEPPDETEQARETRYQNNSLKKILGPVGDWQAEWKWDGIRAQLIRRGEEVFVWTRGEELVTDRFPEIAHVGRHLPDGTVLDGEILPWAGEKPLRFADLQRRINVKTVGKKVLAEVPVVLLAYDVLEVEGRDIRHEPLSVRRAVLESIVSARHAEEALATKEHEGTRKSTKDAGMPLRLSPVLAAESWSDLAAYRRLSRENDAEGLMLKRLSGPYGVGRVRGEWWKWKIEPYTIDAVLVYAQRGHGRRASLYSDYTFALWHEGALVPMAKAYSGLTDAEIKEVDAFIRKNTLERFGPVRTVKPELVMELAFEGIQVSARHKSGVATRFPRIAHWRRDKKPEDADTLDALRVMAGLNEAM